MLYETSILYTPCIPSALPLRNKTKEKIIGGRNRRSAESLEEERPEKKNKTKKFKPNNRYFAILFLFEISLRNERRFPTSLPVTIFFFQARESSDNENLNAFHGYYHWLWSHCGLDRSRSSMPVLLFVELSMIADSSRFRQKCACKFKIEQIKKSNLWIER